LRKIDHKIALFLIFLVFIGGTFTLAANYSNNMAKKVKETAVAIDENQKEIELQNENESVTINESVKEKIVKDPPKVKEISKR